MAKEGRDPKVQERINALIQQEIKDVERLQQLNRDGNRESSEFISIQQRRNANQIEFNRLSNITMTGLKKVNKDLGAQEKKAREINNLFAGLADSLKGVAKDNANLKASQKAFAMLARGTADQYSRQEAAAARLATINEQMPNLSGRALKIGEQIQASRQFEVDLLAETGALYSDIADEAKLLGQYQLGTAGILAESLNTQYAQERLAEAEAMFAAQKHQLTGESLKRAEQELEVARKTFAVLQAQADVLDYQISQREAITEAVMGPFESLKSSIESLPGGSFLSKAIGLDVFNDQMERIIQESVQKGLMEGPQAGIDKFKELIATTKVFGMSLKSALLPLLAIGALLGAVLLFQKMSAETEELAKNTGQSANQAEKMLQNARQMQASSANNLANTEEIVEAMTALKEEFGSAANFSKETAMNVANMSAAFGIAVGDAAAVQRQFEAMGQSSEEAFNTQALTANLAEAAGVAPGRVMKDIATNSKKASKYLGGSAKELAKAAVTAARLGMELGDMVDIADGLLDIESSIEAEFEASVMLGKRINMDLARQLALQGDIEGATREVLNQVGSIHDFNKMGVLERKKIAQAAGMEVGQLQDALQKQEQMNSLTAEQRKRYDEATKALEGGKLTGEDLVKQQEAALAAKEMSANFDKMKNTLMKALYPVIKAITQIFTDILGPILTVIGGVFKGFMFVLQPVFWVVKQIAKVFEFLAPILTGIAATMGVMWMWQNKTLILEKASLLLQKARKGIGAFIGKMKAKEAMTETAIGATKKANLATDQLSTMERLKQVGMDLKKLGLAMKHFAIAAKDLVLAKGRWLLEKIGLGFLFTKASTETAIAGTKTAQLATTSAQAGVEKASLMTKIAQNVQNTIGNAWETAKLTILNQQWLVEQGKLLMKQAQVAWTTIMATKEKIVMALQSKGLLKMVGQAAMKAYQSAASIPYVGWILGAAAAAAVVALGMSFMSDGVISPKSGGSGFGDRVLFGPEGAISFNNKDTIVAGTDLKYGNDVVSKGNGNAIFAPKGALKMNDGAINASPGGGMGGGMENQGPQEVELVDIKKKAAKKLLAIEMIGSSPMGMLMGGLGAMAGGLGGLLGGDEEEEGGSPVFDATNAEKMDAMLAKLDAVVTAIAKGGGEAAAGGKPVQIVIGNKVIEEIKSQMDVNQSYNVSTGNAGEA